MPNSRGARTPLYADPHRSRGAPIPKDPAKLFLPPPTGRRP